MALTSIAPWRQSGYKLADDDVADNAQIETSKLGTRTIRRWLAALEGVPNGSGAVPASRTNLGALVLPNANSASLLWQVQLPDEWVDGNDITFRVLWDSGSTGGNVKLYVAIASGKEGEALSTEDDDFATVSAPSINTIKDSAITLPAANFAAGDILNIELSRDPADGADTLSADINIFGIDMEFTGRG